jgi:dihydrofolate synthase/folylpolyglutamate synthase
VSSQARPSKAERDVRREAELRAAAETELRGVYARILARTPEHDLAPDLDRISAVTELLGDPQKSFRSVHVTGTNGKSSTARMIERLFREYSLRTGLYTSPHLSQVTERICVDGEPLDAARFVRIYREVEPYTELVDAESAQHDRPAMSFFEVLTAMAFAAFADAPAEVAVVEVGMGGSWDATNVMDADVAVITPISLDHQNYLGADLASIAAEKAGIVKAGSTVILAEQPEGVAEMVLARAAEVGARVLREGIDFDVAHRDVAVGGQLLTIRGTSGTYQDVYLPLFGGHQARNAAYALAAAEILLSSGTLEGGLVEAAFSDARSPGRLELVRRSPAVLVDAAHNAAGAAALAEALEESFTFDPLIGVVGILTDKDALGILSVLESVLDSVVVTRSASPRAIPVTELGELAREVFGDNRVEIADRLDDAVDAAVTLAEAKGGVTGGVIITGSITLVADARILLKGSADRGV